MNDHRGVIVGIARVASSGLFGVPTLYTTYERALQYLPNPRFTISYILVEPKSPADVADQARGTGARLSGADQGRVHRQDHQLLRVPDRHRNEFLIMTVMGFIVGLSISGQTFYTFVLENLEKFGALKAMGAKSRELILMILFQASFTALTGYGLGIGLCACDLARQVEASGLCRDDHLLESWAGVCDGRDHCRCFQLLRRPKSSADRAVRHFPGMMICRKQPSSNGHREVVWRRRSQNAGPARCHLKRLLRRDAVHRRAVRQRQNDAC